MSNENIARALDSDAPLTTSKHRDDVADLAADDLGWSGAAIVGRTVTIGRPRDEVYAFVRDFQNFPRFMENIESVTENGADGRSHWTIKAPAGSTVEWDSILIEDVPGEVIAWESAENADIRNTGRLEFRDAPAGRGTEITATIVYDPPGGDIGRWIAKLFQREPKVQARRDMRRLKQLLETGEIATNESPNGRSA